MRLCFWKPPESMAADVDQRIEGRVGADVDLQVSGPQVDTPHCARSIYIAPRTLAVWSHPRSQECGLKLRTRAFTKLGAVIAVGVLVSACTPDPGPTPPSTSPTPQPSPTSASPRENTQERKQREAYEAAETNYRAFRAEYDRITTQKGGNYVLTPKLKATAAGPYLSAYVGFLKTRQSRGLYSSGGLRVVYVRPEGFSPPELLLKVCEDGSKSKLYDDAGKQVGKGSINVSQLEMHLISGEWKIWSGKQKAVKTCAD